MRYDKGQIKKWISEWEQSGQSIRAYCVGKPFEVSTFYYWRRKLKAGQPRSRDGKFVSIQVPPSYLPHMSIHYPSGVRIDLHRMVSSEEVRILTGC